MPDREREDQEEVDGGDPDTDEEEQSREPSPAEGVESLPINCFVCDSSFATYGPLGCQHRTLCKRCAMKQATGGKCKVQKASVDTEHRPLRLFSLPLDKGPSGSVSQERVLSTLRIHQALEGLPGEPPSQGEGMGNISCRKSSLLLQFSFDLPLMCIEPSSDCAKAWLDVCAFVSGAFRIKEEKANHALVLPKVSYKSYTQE
ncbi:hypothetical protein PSTG_02527 [Puccinia striiformis f. sp. tritici PST-78]|uniref:Uncharacterized protein n=1 Tax=Puccinia striiformis f. sp. tritici PST-78 TaxID=1165861 RepID=A0A0L0VY40_9BASI|nr:hypothetical protein PSTG_02527 [Puccinia striiformis f. sp. tritici PST-78]